MPLFDIFRKKQTIEELDKQRRERLTRSGRITEGVIIERNLLEEGEIVYYTYNVHGVDYESSDFLDAVQQKEMLKYAPGAKVSILFDPKQHGNSILM